MRQPGRRARERALPRLGRYVQHPNDSLRRPLALGLHDDPGIAMTGRQREMLRHAQLEGQVTVVVGGIVEGNWSLTREAQEYLHQAACGGADRHVGTRPRMYHRRCPMVRANLNRKRHDCWDLADTAACPTRWCGGYRLQP